MTTCNEYKHQKLLLHPSLRYFSIVIVWAVPCKNVPLDISGQRRPRSACASAQSDQDLPCPLTESLEDTTECTNGEQRPRCNTLRMRRMIWIFPFSTFWMHFFTWHGPYYHYDKNGKFFFFFFFWFGFYGPFKNISLISSRSFIEGGRKPEYPEKNHLTIRKQNLAFPHMTRARLEPQRWET